MPKRPPRRLCPESVSGGQGLRNTAGSPAAAPCGLRQTSKRPAAGVLRGDLRVFARTATVLVSHFTGKEVHQHRFSGGVVVETQTAGTDLRTPGRRVWDGRREQRRTKCHVSIRGRWESAGPRRELCENLEGRDGVGGRREAQEGMRHVCTYG